MISSLLNLVSNTVQKTRSNTGVTTSGSELNSWVQAPTPRTNYSMFTYSENLFARILRPQMALILAVALVLVAFGNSAASADVQSAETKIEAVFGTAVEVRPPSAIVVASNSGLVTRKSSSTRYSRSEPKNILSASVGEQTMASPRRLSEVFNNTPLPVCFSIVSNKA